jgi:hypothetical protein
MFVLVALMGGEGAYGQTPNATLAYRDTVDDIPPNYNGPRFRMLKDYPERDPGVPSPTEYPWLYMDVDFNKGAEAGWTPQWEQYVESVISYVKTNVKANENDFNVEDGWYTLPWLAADPNSGREFTHGARYSFPDQLNHFVADADPAKMISIWASTYVNKYGGYTLGQMWSKNGKLNYQPNSNDEKLAGLPWPNGTVMAKVNFVGNLEEEYLPKLINLKNPPSWDLNIHVVAPGVMPQGNKRSLQRAYPLGLDISIRDDRAPTGWVYMTLKYDQTKNSGRGFTSLWDLFSLTGFIFGNDTSTYPSVPEEVSQPLRQSFLTQFAYNWHTGCNGRLENMIGTTQQSCVGCHQTASFVKTFPVQRGYNLMFQGQCAPGAFDPKNSFYFDSVRYPEAYRGPLNVPGQRPVSLNNVLVLYDAILAYSKYAVAP